jgi:microcystin degradation protein MlrC
VPRVLIAGAQQEISSFNPVICDYDFFTKMWGDEIVDKNRGQNSEVGGAIEALEKMPGMELVPTYNAGAGSAGPLEHASFLRIAREFEEAIQPHAGKVDGVFLHFHGSMGTTEELDPEGYLIERARAILGEDIPFVFTGDIHGVTTARMLRHTNGMAIYHTYPHTDFADTGRRAARAHAGRRREARNRPRNGASSRPRQ